MSSTPHSVRFADDVVRRLDRYVRSHPGSSASSVTNLFVDEAMRTEEHPGIMFRPGPTGRRAPVAGGPEVWEVICRWPRDGAGIARLAVASEQTLRQQGVPGPDETRWLT